MSRHYRAYVPEQTLLMPPSLRDWLAEDHLAYFISDAVDAMDLSAFEDRYGKEGPGNQAFDPRMMVKVLIYGYATGVFSSRKIAVKLFEDVAFRVLGAENFPAHRTIADFRKLHLKAFRELFVQVVLMAREAGLVKLGTVAIDGTKVRANASKRKAMSYDRMKAEEKRLREEIRGLVNRAKRTDEEEDQRYGSHRRGDEWPDELATREKRLATIQAAMKRLEERQRVADEEAGRKPGDHEPGSGKKGKPFKRPMGEPDPKEQDNFTDPESRIMKTSTEGYQQCYNAQAVIDAQSRIIVATTVSDNAADAGQLEPSLDAVRENLGAAPKRVLADSGYRSEANLGMLDEAQIDGYVAIGREKDLDSASPPGQDTAIGRMVRKLRTKRGRERYRKRKHIAEPPFGWIKSVLGFRRFSFRGLENVAAEWDLVTLAVNLRRLNGKIEWA
jgi:transposase